MNLTAYAQELRKNATKEERHLWHDFLRDYPLPFRRQKPFGRYILDFYCDAARLAVELDGGQHYEGQNMQYDAARTEFLRKMGIEVLRFTNLEVQRNFSGVCAAIDLRIKAGDT